MLAVIVILILVLVVSLYSETHALGTWLFLMVAHSYIKILVGPSAEHLALIAGIVVLLSIVARKKWTGIPNALACLVILLCTIMSLAAIAGMNPGRSLTQVLLYSKGFVLAILVAGTIKDEPQVRLITHYFLAAVLIAIWLTYYEYFTNTFIIEGGGIQRAGSFTGSANDTARLILPGLPLTLYWATHSIKVPFKVAYYALILLIVGAVMLTQSRGAFVTMTLLLFVLYLRKPSIKATTLGIVVIFGGLLFSPTGYWDRMGTIVGIESDRPGRSIEKREHYVKTGVVIILENPVLGVGMGNFGRAMVKANPVPGETNEDRVAHNMYLEFVVENGIPGGLLFVTLIGAGFLQSLRYDFRNVSDNEAYGLGFCVAMTLLTLLFFGLFGSFGKSSVLWFFTGLGSAFWVMINTRRRALGSQYSDRVVDF